MRYHELLIRRSRKSAIPSDYAFYAPLSRTSALTDETGKALTYNGTMSEATNQGIHCLFINQGSFIITNDITGITSGDHSFTMSIWFRKANTNYGSHDIVFALGKNASYSGMLMGYQNGHPYYSTYNYDVETNIPMDTLWHCYTYTYESSTTTFCLYIDGTLVETTTASGKRNLDSTGQIAIGGQFANYTPPAGGGWYASALIYDRCLSVAEVEMLAEQFKPVLPVISFDDQTMGFFSDGAGTYTLLTDPTGCTFALESGTLPTGVTLNTSTGVISYDGTSFAHDSVTTVRISASKVGYRSKTASIEINLMAEANIPTDTFLYMPFSTDLIDHSTYARSFTTTGTTPTLELVDGIPCATFPAGTYMRSSDTSGFVTGHGNCTLSMWLKIDAIPSNQWNFFLCVGQSGSNKKCTSVGLESPTEYGGGIWGGNGNTQVAPCDVDFNWHHLAYIFDTDHNDVYLDGVKIWTSTSTDTLSIEDGGWGIGNTSTQYSYPPGVITHYAGMRAYYRAVTGEELRALASEFRNPKGIPMDYAFYAPLESATATKARTGQTLTYTGTPVATTVDGIPCLNMTNAFIQAPDTGINMGTDPITICAWAYGLSSSPWCSLIDLGYGSTGKQFIIGQHGSNTHIVGQMYSYYLESDVNIIGGWHFIAFTRSGNDYNLYIDGVLKVTQTVTDCSTQSTGYIGLAGHTNPNYNGYLAACRIYNRVLTANEIHALAYEFTDTIPTDYVLYAPLDSYKQTAETGQTLTYTNADASNFTRYQGIPCLDCTDATRRVLTDTISMSLNGKYTMSVWCAVTTLTEFQRAMCFGNDVAYKSLATPLMYTGTWEMCVGGYWNDIKTGFIGQANTWYNCVQTFDNGVCSLWVNGVHVYTSNTLNLTVDNAIASFGAPTTYTNTNYLRGYVAAGRLYNRVLNASEIGMLASEFTPSLTPSDYILNAPLKDSTTPVEGSFIDKNSNWTFSTAPDGTSAIGNTSSSSFSYSMRFDVATRVTGTNPITLSAWFYDISGTNNCGLMGLGTRSYNHILSPEYSNSTSVAFPWGENWAGSDFGSGNTLRPSANTWHHVVITFDTIVVKWYTDGVLVGTSDNASILNIGSSYLYLGSRVDDNRPFRGYIRNFLVYDRALSASEIQAIYSEGID